MNKNYKIIEKYIANELSNDELKWVEQQLQENKDFAKQLKMQIELEKSIGQNDVIDLKNKLNSAYNEFITNEKKVIKFNFIRKLAIAASIILLVGIASVLLLTEKKYTSQELFAEYYKPYENIFTTREVNRTEERVFTSAFEKYENGKYKEALIDFEFLLEKEPNNEFLLFYAAISEIELGKINNAIKKLTKISKNIDGVFYQQAQWYLGLSYLKINENKQAREIFKSIIKNDMYYKTDAQEILSHLK